MSGFVRNSGWNPAKRQCRSNVLKPRVNGLKPEGESEWMRERERERDLQCAINSLGNDLLTKQSSGITSVLQLSLQLIPVVLKLYVCVWVVCWFPVLWEMHCGFVFFIPHRPLWPFSCYYVTERNVSLHVCVSTAITAILLHYTFGYYSAHLHFWLVKPEFIPAHLSTT